MFSEWESFYVIVGSSGAALIGLQFVVMTLIAEGNRGETSGSTVSAFGTPTIVHLAGALVISAFMSAPWHTAAAASTAIALVGLLGILYLVAVVRHLRRQKEYRAAADDLFWYFIAPTLQYLVLLIAGVRMRSGSDGSHFVVAGVALSLLGLGIRNAWDTVTYIVARKDH